MTEQDTPAGPGADSAEQASGDKELLTLPEVATFLSLHIRSVHTLIRRGHLEVVRVMPRSPRITVVSLRRYVARHRVRITSDQL